MYLGMPTLLELNTLEEQAALCQTLKLSFVEINLNIPSFGPEYLSPEQILKLQEQYGVQFTIHLPEEIDVASYNEPIRLATVCYIESIMNWASACNISTITMHLNKGVYFTLPQGKQYLNEKYFSKYLDILMKSMRQLYAVADALGISLCIENTNNFTLSHISEALKVLSSLKGFAITWDVGHDAKTCFDESQVISLYKNCVKHMHLHDFDNKSNHLPLMTGQLEIDNYLSIAKDQHMKVVIEVKDKESLCSSLKNIIDAGVYKPAL